MFEVNEFNAETNQSLVRTYNEEELSQIEIDLSNITEVTSIPIPDNEILVSAISKLESLGLTTDEAKAIAGL